MAGRGCLASTARDRIESSRDTQRDRERERDRLGERLIRPREDSEAGMPIIADRLTDACDQLSAVHLSAAERATSHLALVFSDEDSVHPA